MRFLLGILVALLPCEANANFLWATRDFWVKSHSVEAGYKITPHAGKHAIAESSIKIEPTPENSDDSVFILMLIENRVMAYFVYDKRGKELSGDTVGLYLSSAMEKGTTWGEPVFRGEGDTAAAVFTRSDKKVVALYFKKDRKLLIADKAYMDMLEALSRAGSLGSNGLGDNWWKLSDSRVSK